MWREKECTSLLSLEDENAGNAKVPALWGPVSMKYEWRHALCVWFICHIVLEHNKGWKEAELLGTVPERDKVFVFSYAPNTW